MSRVGAKAQSSISTDGPMEESVLNPDCLRPKSEPANPASLAAGGRSAMRSVLLAALLLAGILSLALASAGRADAWQVESFDGTVLDQNGDPATQAGSHPWTANAAFDFTTVTGGGGIEQPTENFRNVAVDLPPGLVGNATVVPTCPEAVLERGRDEELGGCPDETAVGFVELTFGAGFLAPDRFGLLQPVYNVERPPGVPALFGFSFFNTVTHIEASVRTGDDYGVTTEVIDSSATLPLVGSKVTFWGVPADPALDPVRGKCLNQFGGGSTGASCPVNLPPKALLTLPTSCAGPQTTGMRATTWQNSFDTASFVSHDNAMPPNPIGTEGCADVPFDPELSMAPTTARAASAAGAEFDVSIPQDGFSEPGGIASSHLKKAVVTLPEGMTVNPASASGLEGCSPAEIGLDSASPAACPEAAKLGSMELETPVLDHRVEGSVYLAQQSSFENSLIAMYLVAHDEESGVVLKVPGKVTPDSETGQLTATFDNQPQLPFSSLHLRFKDGARAPLVTPSECGTYTTVAELTSWSGRTVESRSSFSINRGADGGPCAARGFSPGFDAGTSNPVGGVSSDFNLRLFREDSDQELSSLSVDMPKGLLARISQVDQCPADAAAAGTCGVGSQIGSVTTGAGVGPLPYYITNGRAYLTGPYKGAPFGLSIVVPAVAGPFDLGTVVVRSALYVDPATAAVKVVSDPFPTILEGIPLRVRDVRVNTDRPGFIINPTSCAPMQIAATVTSTTGATSSPAQRFQVGDCAALSFTPRLSLALTGRKQVTTGKHPGVKAVVTQKGSGAAGIKKAIVALPKALALDPDNAQALCEFTDGTKPDLEKHCPAGSIVGRARATTPLLDKPLAGNVYFVKNVRVDKKTGNQIRTLPMIVVALRGEIAVNLKGESSTTRGGQLVNTFASVPDAPVTKFNLNIKGGGNGILAVTRTAKSKINLCNAPRIAEVDLDGHNGKQADFNTRVKTPCAKKAKRKQ